MIHSTSSFDKLMPQVSPTGDEILFYGEVDGNTDIFAISTSDESERRNQHIFIMDRDGQNPQQLTSSGYNYAATFVPNCDYLCPQQ